jgi:hypothetical protein
VPGALEFAGALAGAVALLLASTVAFDVVHASLHRAMRSRHAPLRALGGLHAWHHRFADRNLDVHPEYVGANLRWHVIPEYLTQVAFTLALLLVVPARFALGALALQTLVFALILRARGMDINHEPIASLRAYRPSWFCLPEYHALHHAWPDAYFSSWIKTLDHLLGTGAQLAGRPFALTASWAATPLGAALRSELAAAGVARIETLEEPGAPAEEIAVRDRLRALDVLVVGADGEGAAWIERFAAAASGRKLPPEAWAVAASPGPPSGGARATRRFWKDPRVIYRHLVVSERALGEEGVARAAARRAVRGVRRGFHLVPAGGLVRALAAGSLR